MALVNYHSEAGPDFLIDPCPCDCDTYEDCLGYVWVTKYDLYSGVLKASQSVVAHGTLSSGLISVNNISASSYTEDSTGLEQDGEPLKLKTLVTNLQAYVVLFDDPDHSPFPEDPWVHVAAPVIAGVRRWHGVWNAISGGPSVDPPTVYHTMPSDTPPPQWVQDQGATRWAVQVPVTNVSEGSDPNDQRAQDGWKLIAPDHQYCGQAIVQ